MLKCTCRINCGGKIMGKYFAKNRYFTAAAAAACAAVALVSAAAPLAAHANSGPDYYYGTDGTVLYPVDDCPLEVEGELLTFDVQKFPQEFALDGYNSTVTAEYTFFNPSDEDVVVGMLFPFGAV